jgi:death on curing protein
MTDFLTVRQVLFLHMRLIDETGGAAGIRDLGLLQAAVARPQATFGNEELYADPFAKAAALMHSLISSHPLLDGNKRVGISAAGIFLSRNGYILTVGNIELETFTMRVARGEVDVDEIAEWFDLHSEPASA